MIIEKKSKLISKIWYIRKKVVVFNGLTHILMALSLYLIIHNRINLGIPLWLAAICLILGSLIPDLDHPKSIVGKYFFPINIFIKHRSGFTHSLLGAFSLSLPMLYFGKEYYYLTVLGCLFHLLGDTLTPLGVRWLFPIIKKRYSLKLIKSGGFMERILAALCLLFLFTKATII